MIVRWAARSVSLFVTLFSFIAVPGPVKPQICHQLGGG
jgi:hypothetical protein